MIEIVIYNSITSIIIKFRHIKTKLLWTPGKLRKTGHSIVPNQAFIWSPLAAPTAVMGFRS